MDEKNKMTYLAFFPSWLELLEPLSDKDFRHVVKSVVEYATNGVKPTDLAQNEQLVFIAMRQTIDNSIKKFNDNKEIFKRRARLGGIAKARKARLAALDDPDYQE